MKKWIIALIAAVLALPVFGSVVFAEEDVYEDGEYEVPFVVFENGTEKTSTADNFLTSPAQLKVENGINYFQIEVTNNEMLKSVNLPDQEEETISKEEDTRVVGFILEGDLNELVKMETHVVVPGIYDTVHKVDVKFDMSEVPVVEETEEDPVEDPEGSEETEEDLEEDPIENPEEVDENEDTEDKEGSTEDEDQSGNDEGTNEDENQSGNDEGIEEDDENEEDSNDDESAEEKEQLEEEEKSNLDISNLDDGFYTIGADYLYIDKDDPSTMGSYLDDSIFLEVKNGKVEVTVTINEDETVTLLQVAGKDSIESKVEGEERHETFEFDELESILNAYVEYQAPFGDSIFEGEAEFRIVLDESTITESEESAKPGIEIIDEEGGEPTKDPKPTPSPKPDPEPTGNPLAADRAHEINYTILDENGNAVSAADQFFEKPAILLEKDGVYYVQIATNANQYIDSLSNQYGDFIYAGVDRNGNHLYQFRVVGELTDHQIIDMVITVPGVYKGREHTTRLVLDPDSMKEVNAEDYELAASEDNANGPNSDGGQPAIDPKNAGQNGNNNDNGKKTTLDDNTPEKPESGFGSGDNGDSNGENGTSGSDGLNPKTGEETNLMLYALLMLASAVPLVIKARKHFA